jgi:hypothetical protein
MKVACNACGKTLEVAEETRYALCATCGARLRVEQSGGAVTSAVLPAEAAEKAPEQPPMPPNDVAAPAAGVAHLSAQVARLKVAQQISELELHWAQTEQGFRGRHGTLPSAGLSGFVAVTVVIIGIVCIGMGSTVRSGTPMVVTGLFSIVLGFGMGLWGNARAKAYEEARRDYERRRNELVRVLDAQGEVDETAPTER